MSAEKEYTEHELRRFDGEDLPMYVAYNGMIYDVSECPKWRTGMHEHLHFPAQDLTSELAEAPHGEEVFAHPEVKRVGRLVQTQQ
jgi:predicted heme/steroid binding protein